MISRKDIKLYPSLFPLSWVYGTIVYFRNKFFDWNLLPSVQYDIPVICIGNISVGGTGKTPHTEYLIRLLSQHYQVAVLSRGYKRKTKGFVLANESSTASAIGDEPYQIKYKFPQIIVAVDADRRRGIKKLLSETSNRPDVILLDDAYQHRYVKPSYNIVLSDYNRPVYLDSLLPAGRLRESVHSLYRSDATIVTKCPVDLPPIDLRIISHEFKLYAYQDLFFTSVKYGHLNPIFDRDAREIELQELRNKSVLLVTGIASPKILEEELLKYCQRVDSLVYSDHHHFGKNDFKNILSEFESIESNNKIIIITEKDASKIATSRYMIDDLKPYLYCLPIEVAFLSKENEDLFIRKINKHVSEFKRNNGIPKK